MNFELCSVHFQKKSSSRRNPTASAIDEDKEDDDGDKDWLPQSERTHPRLQASSQSLSTARAPQPVPANRQPAPTARSGLSSHLFDYMDDD